MSRPQGLALDAAGRPADYFLTVGGATYRLRPLSDKPGVLAKARKGNGFLSAVPDQSITHYLEDLPLSADITPLAYTWTPLDAQAGTWRMESVVQMLSPAAMSKAWRRTANALSPGDPAPLSAKREFYGIAGSLSEQDLVDELALVDYTDAARTLIALNPDMLCAEPVGAAYIASRHVSDNSNTTFIASVLQRLGPAHPQDSPQQQNGDGWATLIPLNQDDGTPFRMENGLIEYFPDWHPDVDRRVGISLTALIPAVKNDTNLGADITGLSLDRKSHFAAANNGELTGKIWYRHDGTSAVDHGSQAFLDSPLPAWDFRQKNGAAGLKVRQPKVQRIGGALQITFDNVDNWFFRFLGVYFQFLDQGGKEIPITDLPDNVLPRVSPNLRKDLDRGKTAAYAGVLGPAFSIAGIPLLPGDFETVVNLPEKAATVQALYAGCGRSGSPYDPTSLRDVGTLLTLAVNFGLVAFFMAIGASDLSDIVKEIAGAADLIAGQLVNKLASVLNSNAPFSLSVALTMCQYFLNGLAQVGFSELLKLIIGRASRAALLAALPIAGQIMRSTALFIGTIQLTVTAAEVGISPPVYQFDLTFTHDLSLNIRPDPRAGQFPPVNNDQVLYYKITYLFDNGSPHLLDNVDVPKSKTASIPVTLKAIPWGGNVNVSVGFYVRGKSANAAPNDWCAARGTTGLIPNTDQAPPDIVLEHFHIPIVRSTVYIHTSKTSLDGGGGHHWNSNSPPPLYVQPSGAPGRGRIKEFRSITVRQRTDKQKGYLGYSWQGWAEPGALCVSGPAQLDMAANVNTDQNHAQDGYTATCGVAGTASSGLVLSYNLISDPTDNFYVDTAKRVLRHISLDPPDFGSPSSGKSFGMLNMDSTALVLHPAGYAVSINSANSRLEAVQLPTKAVDDSVSAQQFLARTYSGPGSRPGLMRAPMAACVTAEGAILVLESSVVNNRIQAFDLGGNPIPYFEGQEDPHFMPLPATKGWIYLDVATEFSDYIYVLSRRESPQASRLDIYHAKQSTSDPICTTHNVNAAKLTVDFWRSVYTLNYEPLMLPGGAGFPAVTEPSVSFWLPSV